MAMTKLRESLHLLWLVWLGLSPGACGSAPDDARRNANQSHSGYPDNGPPDWARGIDEACRFTVYAGSQFGGNQLCLPKGTFDRKQLEARNFPDLTIGSLTVDFGVRLKAVTEAGARYEAVWPDRAIELPGKLASITIDDCTAGLFEDDARHVAGTCLTPGSYDAAALAGLGLRSASTRSVFVAPGFVLTLRRADGASTTTDVFDDFTDLSALPNPGAAIISATVERATSTASSHRKGGATSAGWSGPQGKAKVNRALVDLSGNQTWYFLGDSLSDQQNTYNAIPILYCPNPAWGYWGPGRFTNGKNWVDYLREDLPSNVAMQNFAYGGSEVLTHQDFRPRLMEQAQMIPAGDHSHDAVFVWSGSNDLNNLAQTWPYATGQTDPASDGSVMGWTVASEILNVEYYLSNTLGFSGIMIAEIPPMQLAPIVRTPGTGYTDSKYGAQRIQFLTAAVQQAKTRINTGSLFQTLVAPIVDLLTNWITGNVGSPFMTDVTNACGTRGSLNACDVSSNHDYVDTPCYNKFFMDQLHPTSLAHCGLEQLFLNKLFGTNITRGVDCNKRDQAPGTGRSPAQTPGQLAIRGADPSVIRVGSTYYSAESSNGQIWVRSAAAPEQLDASPRSSVWSNPGNMQEVWAPQLIHAGSTYYIYFSAGAGTAHRMYVMSSATPDSGYSAPAPLPLPDDKWAVDGNAFNYRGQWWFVWSGWLGDTDGEQDLFIARMSDPMTVYGPRYIISQPRETWERVDSNPPAYINEAPEPIVDPYGQLHVVYSANGSFGTNYCLADLRLRQGGDPTFVWDWYKSNGCMFGANADTLMRTGTGWGQANWDPTVWSKAVGHHSFVLVDGDPNTGPPAGPTFPLAYGGVPKQYDPPTIWEGRFWYTGKFQWWGPDVTYCRYGNTCDTGWAIKFYEGPGPDSGPPRNFLSPGQLPIRNADPSVIRDGDTYISVEVENGQNNSQIFVRMASSVPGLATAPTIPIWGNTGNLQEVWAPKIIKAGNTFYIYFSAGAGSAHRMYVMSSNTPAANWNFPSELALPDDKWAVDGSAFNYGNQWWFVWSGWDGDTNGEQNLYIAPMFDPGHSDYNRYIISQPRETWERVDVNPPAYINEAPESIIDPNGQLHIVYSANGSWDTNYCLSDLRLRPGGDPKYVWDWYKANGCLFSSNGSIMMRSGGGTWDPTLYSKGVGSHSFVLLNGDPNTSPPAGPQFPLAYHGVPNWDNPAPLWAGRYWYSGTFQWWGNITYCRFGTTCDTGWSLKFYE
jgi:GH43 family beta-xylosidase